MDCNGDLPSSFEIAITVTIRDVLFVHDAESISGGGSLGGTGTYSVCRAAYRAPCIIQTLTQTPEEPVNEGLRP